MALEFNSEGELSAHLESLHKGYSVYAHALWDNGNGIRSAAEMASLSTASLERFGVHPLKADNLKTRALEKVTYWSLLEKKLPKQRQEQRVRNILLLQFSGAMQNCSTPEDALTLYRTAEQLPQTSTLLYIAEQNKLYINGEFTPSSRTRSSLFYAYEKGHVPYVLKRTQDVKAPAREFEAYTALAEAGDPKQHHLAGPVKLLELKTHGGHSEEVLLMPMYVGVLGRVPHHAAGLPASTLVMAGKQMIDALNFIHNVGYCHCDVKPDNIYMDGAGEFYLGDYGSMAKTGDTIIELTHRYNINEVIIKAGDKASHQLDHVQLAISLLEKGGLIQPTDNNDMASVQAAVAKVHDEDLLELITRLLGGIQQA